MEQGLCLRDELECVTDGLEELFDAGVFTRRRRREHAQHNRARVVMLPDVEFGAGHRIRHETHGPVEKCFPLRIGMQVPLRDENHRSRETIRFACAVSETGSCGVTWTAMASSNRSSCGFVIAGFSASCMARSAP